MIDDKHKDLSIAKPCSLIELAALKLLSKSLSGLESEGTLEIMRLIDEEFMRHPFLGSRNMRDHLRRKGYLINRKRVQRLMRKMGLAPLLLNPIPVLAINHLRFILTCCAISSLIGLISLVYRHHLYKAQRWVYLFGSYYGPV